MRRWVRDFARQRSSIGNVAALSLGLVLVLVSGPVGDWRAFLHELLVGPASEIKYGYPWGLDRVPGWFVLVLGWGCLAFGLRNTETPPSATLDPSARRRSRWQRFAAAVLVTLSTYVTLAFHYVAPLELTIDVINTPPSTELQVGAVVGRDTWDSGRYRAAFDYLFGASLPPVEVFAPHSDKTHTEYWFPAGWLSLQNWQPNLERLTAVTKNVSERKAAFVSVPIHADIRQSGSILVKQESLEPCGSPLVLTDGNCLVQVAPLFFRQREVHVVFDMAGVELKPYATPPF